MNVIVELFKLPSRLAEIEHAEAQGEMVTLTSVTLIQPRFARGEFEIEGRKKPVVMNIPLRFLHLRNRRSRDRAAQSLASSFGGSQRDYMQHLNDFINARRGTKLRFSRRSAVEWSSE